MREYLLTVLISAAVTYLLTPLVRRGAMAVGAMHAGRDRDVHIEPVPLLGGLAMYGGLAAGLLVAAQVEPLRTVFAGSRVAFVSWMGYSQPAVATEMDVTIVKDGQRWLYRH